MLTDTYNATWVSYSSISDWLECPRLYYLKNVYKNPLTNRKIQIIKPPLALGQAIHEVIEALSILPTDKRLDQPLVNRFEEVWKKYHGPRGGFLNKDSEYTYQERGRRLLRQIEENPGPILQPAIKINTNLPKFWLSREEEIILCGKLDWLQYLPETDSVRIIDFKSGKYQEQESSLQLPIYFLLASQCQTRPVVGIGYWYLEQPRGLVEKQLPAKAAAYQQILAIARKIKLGRKLEKFSCPRNGCHACREYEKVLQGEAQLVGPGEYDKDIYILPQADINEGKSLIL